MYKQTQK